MSYLRHKDKVRLANARRVATRKINILRKSKLKKYLPRNPEKLRVLHAKFVRMELQESGMSGQAAINLLSRSETWK